MFATRIPYLMRFRAGELPAGNEFAGTSVAAEIDGGQRTEFYNPFRRLLKKRIRTGLETRNARSSPR
jgi:hypothetical protein